MPVFQLFAALTPTPLPKGLEQLAQRETQQSECRTPLVVGLRLRANPTYKGSRLNCKQPLETVFSGAPGLKFSVDGYIHTG